MDVTKKEVAEQAAPVSHIVPVLSFALGAALGLLAAKESMGALAVASVPCLGWVANNVYLRRRATAATPA